MKRWIKRVGPAHPDTKVCEAGPQNGEPLSPAERQRFGELCEIVDRGFATWIEVGKALHELIRGPHGNDSQRLYRDTHRTWEAFVRDRFGIKHSHAWRLVENAYRGERVAKMLPLPSSQPRKSSPIGEQNLEDVDAPGAVNADGCATCAPRGVRILESHVRAMGDIPRSLEPEVVKRAVAMGGELTAAKIATAVKQVRAEQAPPEQRAADHKASIKPRLEKCLTLLGQLRRELHDIANGPSGEWLRTSRDGVVGRVLAADYTYCFGELDRLISAAVNA